MHILWIITGTAVIAMTVGQASAADAMSLSAKETLTVLEMDCGDSLCFALRNGEKRTLTLEDTSARIIERVTPGGIVYSFDCRVNVDGQSMTMRRYVCSQECFYEPYVVNGIRIWPDIVRDVFDLVPVRYPRKGNLQCVPRKAARFVIQDATLRICPDQTTLWLSEPIGFIDVRRCYNGDDCYLGPYLGQACHVGMDINHPKGSVLSAPLDFDTQGYFNSLEAGHNNNRWRGIRRWPNGDVWALQAHHLIKLLTPENTRLAAGVQYATTAGVHVGSHQHTHFEFKMGRPRSKATSTTHQDTDSISWPIDFDDESDVAQQQPEVLHIDPWVLFWQTFEDRRTREGTIRAIIQPLGPCRTGERVSFSARASRLDDGRDWEYLWDFGDDGSATGADTQHSFTRSGVYPVTLVIGDGKVHTSCTQHITVNGKPMDAPVLALQAPEEIGFRRRSVCATDVYGRPVRTTPRTLRFVARSSRAVPSAKHVRVTNAGSGALPPASVSVEDMAHDVDWLKPAVVDGQDGQCLRVATDAAGLNPGTYDGTIRVDCPGAVNTPQQFRVVLQVVAELPGSHVIVDDRDPGFYATEHFWVGHRFSRCPQDRRGHNGFYLTNGERSCSAEFARFTPDLRAGRYRVSFSEKTPFGPKTAFNARVRHAAGMTVVRVNPSESRVVGVFEFDEGMDGYVEILAAKSNGLVCADAVKFALLEE